MNRTGATVLLAAVLTGTAVTGCGDGRYRAGGTAEVQHTAEPSHTMNTNDKPVIPVETTTESTVTTTRTTRVTTVTRRTAAATSVTEPRTGTTAETAVTEESDLLDRAESALESAGDAVTGVLTDATRPVPPIR